MPYVSEWGKELAELPLPKLKALNESLKTIVDWDFFRKNYREMNELRSMVLHAIVYYNPEKYPWVEEAVDNEYNYSI